MNRVFKSLNRPVSRVQRRALERANMNMPLVLTLQTRDTWTNLHSVDPRQTEVWRSRDFFVLVYAEANSVERLSICRTHLHPTSDTWQDGITWEDLQRLKRECGRGARCAVEVYPEDAEIVNVTNMRHLWVLPERPVFAWRNDLG